MIYRILADLTLVLHALFIVFVVLGGLFWLRWRWAPAAHLPCAAWGFLIELRGWICPLTPLENSFRRAAGETGFGGGFIEAYLLPLVYPGALTREIQLVLAGAVVLANGVIYGWVWRARE